MIFNDLMQQEVEYFKYLGEDAWTEGPQYDEPLTLKNVRLEYQSIFTRAADKEDKFYRAVLFVFPGQIVDFVEKSKVVFDGEEMYIDKIQPMFDGDFNHYEIGLV